MTTTTSPTDTVRHCYETQDWDGLAALYAPDVLLDMHPPGWRYQTQGTDAASAQWKAIIDHRPPEGRSSHDPLVNRSGSWPPPAPVLGVARPGGR